MKRIPQEIVDRIRESTDIVDLISGYVQLEKKGGNYFGLCPFHPEKTPSFSVHPGKGIFHCFGCGIGGNVFTFLQEHDKLSFGEAVRELAERAGIAIPEAKSSEPADKYDALYRANEIASDFFSRCLWEGKSEEYEGARNYLKDRKISFDLAKSFHLGYAPDKWDGLLHGLKKILGNAFKADDYIEAGLLMKSEGRIYDRFRGRLIFPIYNLSGRPVGFGGRTLKSDSKEAKYINTPQTAIYNKGNLLYGLHFAREQIKRRRECLIVEGYTDLMRLHEGGFSHSVATSGTALTVDQSRLLRRFCQKIILIFDGDSAGSHAALRGGDVLLAAGPDVHVVGLPEGTDPDSFIRDQGAGAFGECVEKAVDIFRYRIELYRREGRLKDASSRTEVAKELIESLVLIPDAIRREFAAVEAAKGIGLAVDTILRELNRKNVTGRMREQVEVDVKDPFADYPVKERGLLEALIRRPELRPLAFSEFPSSEFQHPALKRIASKLEDALNRGDKPKGEDLIEEGTPREDANFIANAVSQTEVKTDPMLDPKAMRTYLDYCSVQDCLRELLVNKLKRDHQQLQHDLSTCSDPDAQKALLAQIKELSDRQKIIQKKMFCRIPPHPSVDFKEEDFRIPSSSE